MSKFINTILLTAISMASGIQTGPMDRVIGMLSKLMKETKAELAQMEIDFTGTTQSCTSELSMYATDLVNLVETIDTESSVNDGNLKSQTKKLQEAADYDADKDQKEGELQANKDKLRIFNKHHSDELNARVTTLTALKNAVKTIVENTKTQGVQSLIELSQNTRINMESRTALQQYLNKPQRTSTGFESSSGGIVNLLNNLHDKFETEMNDWRTAQANAKTAILSEIQTLDAGIKADNTASKSAKGQASKHGIMAAVALERVNEATATKASTEKMQRSKKNYCTKYTREYEGNKKMMTEELQVSDQVMNILSDGGKQSYQASGARADRMASENTFDGETNSKDKTFGFLQVGTSFLQIKNVDKNELAHTLDFLKTAATKTHSQKLALAATRMQMMTGGSFDQVLGMIKKLYEDLEEEAHQEAMQYEACETAKADNQEDLENSQAILTEDKATRDKLESTVAENQDTIKARTSQIAKTDTTRTADVNQRNEDMMENKRIIKESGEAEVALTEAIDLVSNYFGSADDNSDKTKGPSSGIKGIFAMLQQMKQDSSATKSQTTTAEQLEASNHAEYLDDVKIQLATLRQQLSNAKLRLEQAKLDLGNTNERLTAETANFQSYTREGEAIAKQCTPKISYQERMAMRQEEIKNLETALEMLATTDGM